MNRKETTEYLASHADRLSSLEDPGAQQITRSDQVQALLELAEQLQAVLVPMAPDPRFRRRLRGELVLEAQRRQGEPRESLLHEHRKGILIGAAAVGSVASVVGVFLAFLLRWRHSRATHSAG